MIPPADEHDTPSRCLILNVENVAERFHMQHLPQSRAGADGTSEDGEHMNRAEVLYIRAQGIPFREANHGERNGRSI